MRSRLFIQIREVVGCLHLQASHRVLRLFFVRDRRLQHFEVELFRDVRDPQLLVGTREVVEDLLGLLPADPRVLVEERKPLDDGVVLVRDSAARRLEDERDPEAEVREGVVGVDA